MDTGTPSVSGSAGKSSRFSMNVKGLILAGVALGMVSYFLFKFPDMYGLFCRYFGLQLNPNNAQAVLAPNHPNGRKVKVIFEGMVYDQLPVRFYPDHPEMEIELGRDTQLTYHFRNVSDKPVSFKAIHNITPVSAARCLGLKVCFCFTNQTIPAGESRDFPVMFTVTPDLDVRTTLITMRYTLLAYTPGEQQSESDKQLEEQIRKAGGVLTPGGVSPPPVPGTPPAAGVPAPLSKPAKGTVP